MTSKQPDDRPKSVLDLNSKIKKYNRKIQKLRDQKNLIEQNQVSEENKTATDKKLADIETKIGLAQSKIRKLEKKLLKPIVRKLVLNQNKLIYLF